MNKREKISAVFNIIVNMRRHKESKKFVYIVSDRNKGKKKIDRVMRYTVTAGEVSHLVKCGQRRAFCQSESKS